MPSFRSQGCWEISSLEGKTYHEGWDNVKASLITKNILELAALGEFSEHNESRRRRIYAWFGIKAPHLHQVKRTILLFPLLGKKKKLNHKIKKHIWAATPRVQQKTWVQISLSKRRERTACSNSHAADLLLSVCVQCWGRYIRQTQITLSIIMCSY